MAGVLEELEFGEGGEFAETQEGGVVQVGVEDGELFEVGGGQEEEVGEVFVKGRALTTDESAAE